MSKSFNEKAAARLVIKTSVSSDGYIAGVGKNQLSDAQLTFWKEQKKTPDDVFKILQLEKKRVPHDEFVAMVLVLNKYIELTSTKATSSSKKTDAILFNTLVKGFQDNRRLLQKNASCASRQSGRGLPHPSGIVFSHWSEKNRHITVYPKKYLDPSL
ncbi:hypothetical protein PsorP6_007637 [Peronosclerospora sorghi]|uniref:Uncharacterized protein n=1 Tax=Peronosclerospora sorghi TaxID=230839 RepID=A0ACC0WAX2_9STRA|nr:hypothetical protein PsorP6_007637 [Peronosclerospora sorghi]